MDFLSNPKIIITMTAKSVTFVTSNANKLRDVTTILGLYGITVNHVKLALPEIQGTIEEITLEKCRAAAASVSRFASHPPPRADALFVPHINY